MIWVLVRQEVCRLDGTECDDSGERHTKDLYRLTPESMLYLQCASPDMAQMMQPERAWERTLTAEEIEDTYASCQIFSAEETAKW